MKDLKESCVSKEMCNFFQKLDSIHIEDECSTYKARYWKSRGVSKTDENAQSKECLKVVNEHYVQNHS